MLDALGFAVAFLRGLDGDRSGSCAGLSDEHHGLDTIVLVFYFGL